MKKLLGVRECLGRGMPETVCDLERTLEGGYVCTKCCAAFSPRRQDIKYIDRWYRENTYLTETQMHCRAVLLLELLQTATTPRERQECVLKVMAQERETAFNEATTQLEKLAKETANTEALAYLQRAVWKIEKKAKQGK